MNTQSSYVYDEYSGGEGLGRIALPPTMGNRFMPSIEEPARNYRRLVLPPQRKSSAGRISKPKPVLKPKPIIDHNPVPPPRLNITVLREAAQKKANALTTQKKSGRKGILDGRVSIGGYQIKKTHAAVAGGATAGGLLLLKLLL